MIGVECQHCIRRGLLTAEALGFFIVAMVLSPKLRFAPAAPGVGESPTEYLLAQPTAGTDVPAG